MPQGTVKEFDPRTGSGCLLLDSQEELTFEAEAFRASGLRALRIGQRVRLETEQADGATRVTSIDLVSF